MARETQGGPANEKKLEKYGVWVKVKPRTLTEAPAIEDTFELSDLETPRATATTAPKGNGGGALTAEEEQLLDELETDMVPEDAPVEVSVPEEEPLLAEEAELPDIESVAAESPDIALGQVTEEDLPELEEEPAESSAQAASRARAPAVDAGEVEVTLSESIVEEEHFDDLEALESELASVTTTASAVREPSPSSAQILGRIEEELRSIRKDLTQLRTELSGLRKGAAEPTVEAAAAGRADAPGGFFDEDEDETIALTGDELDNILNTADVTEEVAETPSVDVEPALDLAAEEPQATAPEEVLGLETPILEEEIPEPSGGKAVAEAEDELPAELSLDELTEETPPAPGDSLAVDDLLDIDLEGIPEVETPTPSLAPAKSKGQEADEEDETIDLDTLDLGEEPRIINAVPEQVEDLEDIPGAESISDVEEILEAEPVEEAEAAPKRAPKAAAESAEEDLTDLDALSELDTGENLLPESEVVPEAGGADGAEEELDLEALAAEAGELEDEKPNLLEDDLEIGELETVADTEQAAPVAEEEIEIDFESETESPGPGASPSAGKESEPADLIQELEEPPREEKPSAPAAAGAAGIPDNLKDEIRTVLKYMDTLLEALPDEKINEFARSDYFVMYKKLFEDLGLGE